MAELKAQQRCTVIGIILYIAWLFMNSKNYYFLCFCLLYLTWQLFSICNVPAVCATVIVGTIRDFY